MRMWLVKDDFNRFHPYNDHDYEKSRKIKQGEPELFETIKVRDSAFHRKYMSMIRLAYENQENYNDEYWFRKLVEREAGYFEDVKTKNGVERLPKSIRYEKLDQHEFEELYGKVWQVFSTTYGFDEDFINELANYA